MGDRSCAHTSVTRVELRQVLVLRRAVLGWPDDAFDGDRIGKTTHLAVLHSGRAIGAVSYMESPCRERPGDVGCYFWAMAVAGDHRRHGHGRHLIAELKRCARELGGTVLWADARESALPFYIACGGAAMGEPYVDDVTGLTDYRVVLRIR